MIMMHQSSSRSIKFTTVERFTALTTTRQL